MRTKRIQHEARHRSTTPDEPEDRPRNVSPAPAVPLAEAFDEMVRNDPEFRAWRSAELHADLVGRRG